MEISFCQHGRNFKILVVFKCIKSIPDVSINCLALRPWVAIISCQASEPVSTVWSHETIEFSKPKSLNENWGCKIKLESFPLFLMLYIWTHAHWRRSIKSVRLEKKANQTEGQCTDSEKWSPRSYKKVNKYACSRHVLREIEARSVV